MTKTTNILSLTLSGLVILSAVACTPSVAQRGNLVEEEQMANVIPGESTRSDVLRIMGSPTTIAPFNNDVWYYIGQETAKHGILDPEVVKERVVIVTFSPDDYKVLSVRESDAGRIDVPLSADKTVTHGNDITIMQQFLGNLGRFNPQSE